MTTWTPPASTSLSSADISNLATGLLDLDHRSEAFAFLETVPDAALIYTVAAEVAYQCRSEKPDNPQADRETHLRWIGNRI